MESRIRRKEKVVSMKRRKVVMEEIQIQEGRARSCEKIEEGKERGKLRMLGRERIKG